MRALLLTLLLMLAGCVEAHPREYAVRIETETGICGGTAVGPDLVETAVHCLSGRLRLVNDVPAEIVGSEQVGSDRVRLVVSGIRFKTWARMGVAAQGDRVRWWGHPMGARFVYREGVVALIEDGALVVDATICFGDSGSGLFNEAGELVGVISGMSNRQGCTFMVAH